ncbi:MAG TPA: hypothetical protein VGI84_01555 [Pseudonocardiaceae bacterium]
MIRTLLAVNTGSATLSAMLAVVAACSGGGLAAVIQWLAKRGKSSAEEIEIWTRSSLARLRGMHEEMTLLERRLRDLNAELERERTSRVDCAVQLRRARDLLAANGIPMDS